MSPNTLAQRLRLGEDSRTELKSVARSDFRIDSHTIAKAVVAMANSGGGVVDARIRPAGARDQRQRRTFPPGAALGKLTATARDRLSK